MGHLLLSKIIKLLIKTQHIPCWNNGHVNPQAQHQQNNCEMPQIHFLGYSFYPFAVLQDGSDRSDTGDKLQARNSICPGMVTICEGWGGQWWPGLPWGVSPTLSPSVQDSDVIPWAALPLSPLPPWCSQGSASLIYVTAAVFRCCHSHIHWKTWYLKNCYTSTAYAGGKTIYIY